MAILDEVTPGLSTLVKLGSIIVHVDEMLSEKGHSFDEAALKSLLNDPDIKNWLHKMDGFALIPSKR
jgi:hypothetical protein